MRLLRTKESLLLKDKSALFKDNAYGINKPTVLAKLSTFVGVESIGLEELHAISNIFKLFYEMISHRYKANFKYIGNEAAYPFQLSHLQFQCLGVAMASGRQYIPTGAFQGSFYPVDPSNVKSIYRSTDWIEWPIYVVPTFLVGLLDNAEIRKGVLGLSRGCALAMQWTVSKENIEEMKVSFELWSLEKEIGNYKKKMRARVNVDANAINVFERITRYKFLETTGMIDFSTLYNRNPDYKRRGFIEHPAAKDDPSGSAYPQLWEPFFCPAFLTSSSSSSNTSPSYTIEGLILTDKFIKALSAYKKRFLGVGKNAVIDLDLGKPVTPVAKLWSDGHVLTSSIFKENLKATTFLPG
ncbi:hypothetical protein [Parasitella parasitica]|uniref:Uncharacterized protein n=1 Tax=Parasitella parasitica TaxID=35722 RepID=A0A0B7NR92_9FUNG|nr:hypothetical protein [Parasitella parasitica]